MDPSFRALLVQKRDEALDWLLRAQRQTPDGGVCAWFDLQRGWCPTSYPEVTGYIIPTMWDAFALTGSAHYRDAAIEMTDWITEVQHPDGYVTSMDFQTPYVFDTGQDILGWVRSYRESGAANHLDAAVRAGEWLLRMQRADGSWWTTPTSGASQTYHSRVAWSLLQLADATSDTRYADAARRNLDWAVERQEPNGWFRGDPQRDMTHFLEYAVRGLIESGLWIGDDRYVAAGKRMADRVLQFVDDSGYLCGWFRSDWTPDAPSCCLTGSIQFAIVWLALCRETSDAGYRELAHRAMRYVIGTQTTDPGVPETYGAIAGSEPVDSEYAPMAYLSWGTKFLIDAIHLALDEDMRLTS